jgi:uncharacterized protein (DUF697 family)
MPSGPDPVRPSDSSDTSKSEPDDATKGVARAIRSASIAAAALGVVLSPIPLADELVLLPVYGMLTASIARSRGVGLHAVPWRPIALTALAGLGARAALNLTVSYIPFVAAAANAASGVALTRFLGHYVDAACETARKGGETAPLGLRDFAEALRPKSRAPAPGTAG